MKRFLYNLTEFACYGRQSYWGRKLRSWWREEYKARMVTISSQDWRRLQGEVYSALPRKEAAKALKILYSYERYMGAR